MTPNKYVIRLQIDGFRMRQYFTSYREACEYAKECGLPKSQVKKL